MPALADRTWPEASGTLLAVPVGSLEQHGPHLPLSTDSDIAVALSERLRQALPETTVAPLVAYGASGEHEAFPGTVSIGHEALELLLMELGRSASASFTRIVLVSTHGGNALPVSRAVARLRREGRDVTAWFPRWEGDAHAGRLETSVMLALDPSRVQLSRAAAGNATPLPQLMPELVAHGVQPVSANGVLGDPTGASAAEGEALLAAATGDLLDTVRRS